MRKAVRDILGNPDVRSQSAHWLCFLEPTRLLLISQRFGHTGKERGSVRMITPQAVGVKCNILELQTYRRQVMYPSYGEEQGKFEMLAVVVTTNATSPKACVTMRTLFPMWHLPVQKGRLGRWIQPPSN